MRKGFTLIELLIVMAILGILSTLGIGNFQSSRIKARDLSKKSDLQTIAKSLEAYANDHRTYPRSDGSSGKIICKTNNDVCDWGQVFSDGANLSESKTIYAAKLPTAPSGVYWYTSIDGTSYTLSTSLENSNDQSIIPEFFCNGSSGVKCNYKITSSNI
ncbi:MAG: type II secretion system protein [bacterium]